MWDEDDHTGRWIQGICAALLAIFAIGGAYMALHSPFFMFKFGGFAVLVGSVRLCWRCSRYALTGKDNINRDDF